MAARTPPAGEATDSSREHRRSKCQRRCCGKQVLVLVCVLLVIPLFVLVTLLPAALTSAWSPWTGEYGKEPDSIVKGSDFSAGNETHDEAGGSGREHGDVYLLGVGKADITGPVVEINLMGYADPSQLGTGLRQRLYSRAFIVADPDFRTDTFVYLVLDTQSGDTAVRYGILEALRNLGPEYAAYGHHNLAVTGTHSHSGPGAWLNYLLPQITSKGFDRQSYRAIVEGAVLSIRRAHESLSPGYLSVGSTKVEGANINRSLFAYLANPEAERKKYNQSEADDGSVEKDLALLKFQRANDRKNIGVLTWFPTHGTSMLGNNTLVTGDNKGVAASLFEKSVAGTDRAADGFVAGFSQANVGDTSPNVLGAWCEDGSGQMCDFENSTCADGKSQQCHARGPFFQTNSDDSGAASCYEIGKRQSEPAKALYDHLNDNESESAVRGRWVKSFHTFHDMSNFTFILPNGTGVSTCPAALGYSFAAGTSDGPGAFDFTQHGSNSTNTSPVWRVVSGLLKEPSQEQRNCHHPKPVLLDVGEVTSPYLWTPNIVDVQVFRVGQLLIIVSPGEATTMAGRRWKDAVREAATSMFSDEIKVDEAISAEEEPVVVLGGPANSYTHYITTGEEYGIQRYEGASTLYGPHTLAAYINVTLSYLSYLNTTSTGRPPKGPQPPDNSNRSLSFIPGVVRDGTPLFRGFGDVIDDVKKKYRKGDTVKATFVGANPRNNLRLEDTYAAVERLVVDEETSDSPGHEQDGPGEIRVRNSNRSRQRWVTVASDDDWSLIFRWRRISEVLATSEVEISWEAGSAAAEAEAVSSGYDLVGGVYRLRYFGDSKGITGKITAFEGVSSEFRFVA